MLIIGLTGGIASGKTAAAHCFAAQGVTIVDADVIAREVVMPGMPAYQQIVTHFGKKILNPDNTLNRKTLRELIFTHPQEKIWLENTLHPIIRHRMQRQAQQASSAYCILVIPLLVETLPYPFIDRILVIDVDEETQIQRLIARDQTDRTQAQQILTSQASRQQRLAVADDVISNSAGIEELEQAVRALHQMYLGLAAKN